MNSLPNIIKLSNSTPAKVENCARAHSDIKCRALKNNEIHVYILDISKLIPQEQLLCSALNKAELERARRFIRTEHGQRFSLVRGQLRHLLGFYMEAPAKSIVFQYNEHGQPLVQPNNIENLYFNISHSNNMAAFAFSADFPVGIDIEWVRHLKNQAALAQYICSDAEYEQYQNYLDAEKKMGFFRLWTRKEAFIKANGQGLRMGLKSINIGMQSEQTIRRLQYKDNTLDNWLINDLSCPSDYQSAIAVKLAHVN